jgi:hypothetical protein
MNVPDLLPGRVGDTGLLEARGLGAALPPLRPGGGGIGGRFAGWRRILLILRQQQRGKKYYQKGRKETCFTFAHSSPSSSDKPIRDLKLLWAGRILSLQWNSL